MAKQAYESFAFTGKDGTIVVVNSDDVYADDHAFVKRWPDKFRDLNDVAIIEQATAAPGEVRRGPGRPRKEA